MMKSLLIILLLLSQGVSGVQSGQPPEAEGRVVIEKRRVVLKRGEDAPEYQKQAIVTYPVVKGIKDEALLRRVQAAVSLKKVVGRSLDELRTEVKEIWWLQEIRYQVNYNKRFIFDITFVQRGMGAYPWDIVEHRVINLKTGNLLNASDVFNPSSLSVLVRMVNQAMHAEVQRTIKEVGKEDKENGEMIADRLADARFRLKHLNQFSVSDKGVTFLYDHGFPHVIKALEPPGRYFFSYEKLKAHIKREGLLGPFVQ